MFETVIFLDVDGVLNCETSKSYVTTEDGQVFTGIDKDKVKRLASIVAATRADIVLSSSWKNGWYTSDGFLFGSTVLSNHAKYLRNHLYKKGKLFIRDKTSNSYKGRGEEITFWLKMHPQTKAWVVLDDEEWHDFYEYDEIMRHWVKTDYETGLTDEDATAAIQILKGQLLGPFEKEQEAGCYSEE